jgi:magnesium transporter
LAGLPGEAVEEALRQRDFVSLRAQLAQRPAQEVADLIAALPVEEQVVVFRILPRDSATRVFEYLALEAQEGLLKAMAQEEVAAILNQMSPDDRTELLEELPAAATRQLLSLLAPGERAVALSLLGYPEGSIGRLMTPDYVAVREDWTMAQVLEHVRTHGRDSETLSLLYVVDERGTLIDDIRIRQVLLAPPEQRLGEIMDRNFLALKATDEQEAAVAVFRRADRAALPVTDSAGVLIGIVTVDDVLDVAEEAATEDIQRIGGSEALQEPYLEVGAWTMVRKRAPWLVVLFLGEMLTATAMGFFESEIERAVVLALFIPLIISSGGNSGSQASTLVIRALALGELRLANWWRVLRRELVAGAFLGLLLGAIGFARVAVTSTWSDVYGAHWALVGLTLAATLVSIVVWGAVTGAMLPFVLHRLGFDPATSSAPFVATLVDVTGLVIYFTVAALLLRGTLL